MTLKYEHPKINSIEELAKILSISKSDLIDLSNNIEKYYIVLKPKLKLNGDYRQIVSPQEPLKSVQQRIMQELFYKVKYPDFIQGGIKDKLFPRGYTTDAHYHKNERIIIHEDINNFFSSIKSSLVRTMWMNFFCFPNDVSILLTKLTTYKGVVPQGASTSSYIANTIFWDCEPALVKNINNRGIIYSRYIDDITISSSRYISKKEQETITRDIYKMFFAKGLKPNREKRKVQTSGNRMDIHNLNKNCGKPTISKQERNNLRAAVKQCEIDAISGMNSVVYKKKYESVRAKLSVYEQFHPTPARKLINRLEKVKPI